LVGWLIKILGFAVATSHLAVGGHVSSGRAAGVELSKGRGAAPYTEIDAKYSQ